MKEEDINQDIEQDYDSEKMEACLELLKKSHFHLANDYIEEHLEDLNLTYLLIYALNDKVCNVETVSLLHQKGVDLSFGVFHTLKCALHFKNTEVLEYLIKHQAPADLKQDPAYHFVQKAFLDSIKGKTAEDDAIFHFLLNKINIDFEEQRALRTAVRYCKYDKVKKLLDSGADASVYTYAYQKDNERVKEFLMGDLSTVKLLVEHGADIHLYSEFSLSHAISKNNIPVIEYLLEQGCDSSVIVQSRNEYVKSWYTAKNMYIDLSHRLTPLSEDKPEDKLADRTHKKKI